MLGALAFDMSIAEVELSAVQWVLVSGHAALLATATLALAAALLLLTQRRARRLSLSSSAAGDNVLQDLASPPGPGGYPFVGYLGLLKIFRMMTMIK